MDNITAPERKKWKWWVHANDAIKWTRLETQISALKVKARQWNEKNKHYDDSEVNYGACSIVDGVVHNS